MLRTRPVQAEALLDHVKPNADLIIPIACGEPTMLVDALEAGNELLSGVRIHQMHVLHERAYLAGEYYDRLRHVSYFLSPVTRKHFWAGSIDLIPANFSELPQTLHRTAKNPVVIAATSEPDNRGYFSFGTNADYVTPLIGKVPFFLEVTPHMPRTLGVNAIHESQVAGWIESDRPLPIVNPVPRSELDEKIASFIAPEIANGATLQVGIGGVPNAVMAMLKDHKELGVHTELLSDGLVELVECGAVTGAQKKCEPHKLVSTFCMGSQHLYDWLDGNEMVEMRAVDHVNDPRIIGQEPDFVSINATAEVDLFGQCASETIAGQYWSSSGGQADFSRGAMFAERGKAFMVLHSTTADGKSKIRSQLTPGAVVTTNKNTVDHIVTEYGIARLRGRTITERAQALIAIAHPDHREQLERDAHEHAILRG